MPHSSRDLTDLAVAARTNDSRAVGAFAERFATSRLHLPLARLEGVKNRPEIALELKERLPIHRLRLDNGEIAIPLFTSSKLCRLCADRLSWQTDGTAIKTLGVTGAIALSFLKELLVPADVERAILNPMSPAPLHLARTDVEAIASQGGLRSLWFYTPRGRLVRPVEIEGSSLLVTLLSRADRALQWLADGTGDSGAARQAVAGGEIFESFPTGEPLAELGAELYQLARREGAEGVELAITKSAAGIRVEARPSSSPQLLVQSREIAERHLASQPGDVKVTFELRGSSVVLSTSSTSLAESPAPRKEDPRAPAPSERGPRKRFEYIPLEPEALPDDESRD